jgi:hypothetical protein
VTALSNMAAATRPSGLGDARVPCPLCGGLIHPVAGRCKHCKEDLSTLRAGRPQAATQLPSLNAAATPVPAAPAAPAASAIPVAIPAAREGSQPILPQRPTSQWRMKAQKEPGRWLRNWPLIVIVLAVLAIVAAVVIMVLPQDKKDSGRRQLMPAPAPDRMDTHPSPKQSQLDPWSDPGAPGTNPTPDPPPAPPADPNDPDPVDPDDPDDLYGGLLGGSGTFGGQLSGVTGTFAFAIMERACKKALSCPGQNQQVVDAMCMMTNSMPRPPLHSTCDAGKRCLAAIDQLDCSAIDASFSATAMLTMKDCLTALSEC